MKMRKRVEGGSRAATVAMAARPSITAAVTIPAISAIFTGSTHRPGCARRAGLSRVSLSALVACQTHVALGAIPAISPVLSSSSFAAWRSRRTGSSTHALWPRRPVGRAYWTLDALHAT